MWSIILITIILIIILILFIYALIKSNLNHRLIGGLGFIDGDDIFSEEQENYAERMKYYKNNKIVPPPINDKLLNNIIKKQSTIDGKFKLKLKEIYDNIKIEKRFFSEVSSTGFLLFNLKNKMNIYKPKLQLENIENLTIKNIINIGNSKSEYAFYKYNDDYIIPLVLYDNEKHKLRYKYNIPDGLIQFHNESDSMIESLFYEIDEKFNSYHWKKSIISDCLYILATNFIIQTEDKKNIYLIVNKTSAELWIGNINIINKVLHAKNLSTYSLRLDNLEYCIRHYCFNNYPSSDFEFGDIPMYYEKCIEYKDLYNNTFIKINESDNIFYDLIVSIMNNHKI